jgi:holin-like protein
MKYLSQFGIILAISFVGEVLNRIIPLPIPASIYGMVLLFVGLLSGVVKLSSVKDTGKFLIEIMPLLFIPATVGRIESWALMQDFLVAIIVISLVSTVVVAAAAGRITQFIINRKTKK